MFLIILIKYNHWFHHKITIFNILFETLSTDPKQDPRAQTGCLLVLYSTLELLLLFYRLSTALFSYFGLLAISLHKLFGKPNQERKYYAAFSIDKFLETIFPIML